MNIRKLAFMKTKVTRGMNFIFFQAEDGIRDLVRSRGLGDVYKRQGCALSTTAPGSPDVGPTRPSPRSSPITRRTLIGLSLIHI